MTREKMSRLQVLFEKMVANCANEFERRELQRLYVEYIDFGRSTNKRHLRAVNQ